MLFLPEGVEKPVLQNTMTIAFFILVTRDEIHFEWCITLNYLLTYLPTYILTYLLHGAEFFLRS